MTPTKLLYLKQTKVTRSDMTIDIHRLDIHTRWLVFRPRHPQSILSPKNDLGLSIFTEMLFHTVEGEKYALRGLRICILHSTDFLVVNEFLFNAINHKSTNDL